MTRGLRPRLSGRQLAPRRLRQRERELHQASRQSQADDQLPGEIVRTQRVEQQSAAQRSDEAAELMAHEGDALNHRLPAQAEHCRHASRNRLDLHFRHPAAASTTAPGCLVQRIRRRRPPQLTLFPQRYLNAVLLSVRT